MLDSSASSTVDSNNKARRSVLYIDAYDSFTNSIIGLLEKSLDVSVTTIRIDESGASENFKTLLGSFDAVVVGPGPGHPSNPNDTGLINQIWNLDDAGLLPVMGICLGFQSLCLAHGATIKRLKQARHGIVSHITHNRTDIFRGITKLRATQYHSLHADLGGASGDSAAHAQAFWEPTVVCPKLRPLAWDNTDEVNGPVLMAVKHTEKPFWGVQFHPESICTSKAGTDLMRSWWKQADEWLASHPREVRTVDTYSLGRKEIPKIPSRVIKDVSYDGSRRNSHPVSELAKSVQSGIKTGSPMLQWAKHNTGKLGPTLLAEALRLDRNEVVLLDSQNHSMGRFSILGVIIPDETVKITYRSWDKTLRYTTHRENEQVNQLQSVNEIWPMLQEVLDIYNPRHHDHLGETTNDLPYDNPFWGGFMGYISYEAGLETIDVELHKSVADSTVPDVNFAFVHRSVVVDHATGQTYVQSLSPDDSPWVSEVGDVIKGLINGHSAVRSHTTRTDDNVTRALRESLELEKRLCHSQISTPQERQYRNKVLKCQESLAAGDSYELCLTDETLITVPKIEGKGLDAWALYKKLRRKNPAPYGAFMQLSNATVVGTSPERFLKWSRDGHCQFRPIKGTVKKSPSMTREAAHEILNSSKEQAENLMIVDLIRHDLSGVIGAECCSVPKLMTIEEYEHVYQLVSVIEGQIPTVTECEGPTGLDVLKASLPPGSMTGAPKKRSCEILRDIEQRPRGIYSGVLGYLDVGGAGDFSVVIRTALRDTTKGNNATHTVRTIVNSSDSTPRSSPGYTPSNASPRSSSPPSSNRDERFPTEASTETWRIPAGGAVTIQSTDEGEFLEMETKVMSALTAFQSN